MSTGFLTGFQPKNERNVNKFGDFGSTRKSVAERRETYCSGLFLSARWFVISQICKSGLQVIVLPDKDSAEYCAADLYNLVEGDNVFFLPDSGKNVERSNYKSSLAVQRTAAIGSILADNDNAELLYIVTYPEALEEMIPDKTRISGALLTLEKIRPSALMR